MQLLRTLTVGMLVLALLALSACPGKKDGGGSSGQGGGTTAAVWGNASDFSFNTADGKTVKLSSYGGRPLVVNFWAVW